MKIQLIVALTLLSAVSCRNDLPANGTQRCAPEGDQRCPKGYECKADLCWLPGTGPADSADASAFEDALVEGGADSSVPQEAGAESCVLGSLGNCGQCGVSCRSDQTCDDGLCCAAGLKNCGGRCVDVTLDSLNCGMCTNACPSSSQCSNGLCKALDGQPCAGPTDCLSGKCTTFFKDDDGDTYGTDITVGRCTITEPPAGYAKRAGDCCDDASTEMARVTAAKIHPNADWQTRSAGGICGRTWDFDCDGKVLSSIEKRMGCSRTSPPCDEVATGPAPEQLCGNSYYDCGECKQAAAFPGQTPSCYLDTSSNCVDSTILWECR